MKHILLLVCALPSVALAQQISGVVTTHTDGHAEPLEGALVYWARTTQGTVTDADGRYSIEPSAESNLLVATYVGFAADTAEVVGSQANFDLQSESLEQVDVLGRRSGASISRMDPLNTTNITSDELCKAPCCNLGESFETNASVDVSYTDATTGAKTIQLLGLNGRYVQLMTENVPNLRGVASVFGLSYVPGPWMDGIQVSKGVGTVVNGYEAFTGQINIEYKKPVSTELASANVFASSSGRMEFNGSGNIHVHDRLRTGILVNGSLNNRTVDDDHDGFRDEPELRQINLLNRWNYSSGGGYNLILVAKYMGEERTGGSTAFSGSTPSSTIYGVHIKSDRVESWMKNAFVFDRTPASLGIITSYMWHRQRSFFGLRQYDADQHSYVLNTIFQTGNDRHTLHAGLGSQGDFYRQTVGLDDADSFRSNFDDLSFGAFGQYTLVVPDRLTVIAGLRVDRNNHFGTFLTPRLHVKLTPTEHITLRLAAGKGYRTAALFAENNYLLASSRQWSFDREFAQERGWNFGASLTGYIDLFGRELTLSAEYYRTQFDRQLVANYDLSPRLMRFDYVSGGSYSNTVQVEGKYQPFRGMEVTAAWRLNDARQTLNGEKHLRPLQSRYKGLVALSYATPLRKWQFDFNLQLNGGGRVPTTEGNPEQYLREGVFHSYQVYNAQVTKFFRTWSIYIGAENIGDYMQANPIIASDNPYSEYFDGTMVWGPIMGRSFHIGLRWALDAD